MPHLQGKWIRGIDGNWDHMMEAHDVTEAEVISVFQLNRLQPKRNKKKHQADYMVMGRAFTGRVLRICYQWDKERPGWIWVHTAF